MNKYESSGELFPANREARLEFNKAFNDFREIVLNNKDYALGRARDIIDSLDKAQVLRLFENFNDQEGALPDNLAIEYIKLIYGPENLRAHLDSGEDFYEALSKIAIETRTKNINLNPELVNNQIKNTQKILEEERMQEEDNSMESF